MARYTQSQLILNEVKRLGCRVKFKPGKSLNKPFRLMNINDLMLQLPWNLGLLAA